ncbi:MAG: metallophosphoesterase [Pseudomonadales bacterium]|nr:metallophosphoesterase [Pseudomonadales bacterium]
MSLTVLQISDCHLGDIAGETLLGLNTDESLLAVLALVNEVCPQPDLVVFSGDISNTGGDGAYPRLLAAVKEETSICAPMLWLPGNHDDNQKMQAAVSEGFLGSKTMGAWQISCFDSSIPKAVPGNIEAAELQRSENILKDHAAQHHLFFIHHHLKPVNCAWLDPQRIANAEAVMACWGHYPQLKVVAHGHVHQQQQQKFSHVDIYSTPSTCIQFKPDSDDFSTGEEMPGFRVFTLDDDGSYCTDVYRISERDLGIDRSASGY